jgi:uncharacterized protein
MRALLDVNVVIALLDPDHAFHERSHEWWLTQVKLGWASCPIAENGVVRIMSNPGYSKKTLFAPSDLISRLQTFIQRTDHEFWPDILSLRDEKIFTTERIHSSRQLTDFYLLALAAKHGGMLATFDQSIPISAVKIAGAKNLCVL